MTPPAAPHNGRRLALVSTELGVGGAERCLAQLALGLARLGFLPEVYSLAPPPSPPRDSLVRQLRSQQIPTHFVGVSRSTQFARALGHLKKMLREQRPELVQTFLFHANVIGAVAARWAGVPHVVAGIRVADPSAWRHRVERYATRRVDRIVCVSRSVADFARETAGFPAAKLCVIPNGIDVSSYETALPADLTALGIPADRRTLVAIGRLHTQKGLDWLLELMPRIFAELSRHDLLLVGDGPQRESLEKRAEQLGLASRIHFAGWRDDIPAILRASAGLLLPSRWEGMPNVLIEAMAAGLPVAAARVEGVDEVLGPLANAQGAAPGADQDFITRVVCWGRDPHLAATLGRENQERIAKHYSLDAMIAAYAKLYEELAGP